MGESVKRSWAWILGVGIVWTLAAGPLASLVENIRVSLALSDFVSSTDHLGTIVDVLFEQSVALPIVAAALCFLLVSLVKAPSRVWLGVLLGVALGWAQTLARMTFMAALLGMGSGGEFAAVFGRQYLLPGCATVLAAWVGVSLAGWWSATGAAIREARDERDSEGVAPQVPSEPDDWDEPFDTRADDARA